MENNQESKRAQFEAWFDSLHDIKHPRWFDRVSDDRRYCSMEVEYAWLAWCASPAVAAVPDLSGLTATRIKELAEASAFDVIGGADDARTFKFGEITILDFARAIEREVLSQQAQSQQGQGEIPASAPAQFAKRYVELHDENRTLKARIAELEAAASPVQVNAVPEGLQVKGPDGRYLDSDGWSTSHEKFACNAHVPIIANGEVIALVVAVGDYEELEPKIERNISMLLSAVPPVTAPAGVSDDLHNAIMNLSIPVDPKIPADAGVMLAYKIGHRDARHAAAELAAGVSESQVRDAARYHWFRRFGYQAWELIFHDDGTLKWGNDLDTAIDSAIAATPTVSPASQTEGEGNGL